MATIQEVQTKLMALPQTQTAMIDINSDQNPRSTEILDQNLISKETRLYALNRQKALENKLQNCQSEHLQYVMKAGKNLVINLSTSAFEHFRHTLSHMMNQQSKNLGLHVESKVNVDLTDAIVDSSFKVKNLKKDGTPGAQNRFTVNLYRTQSSILVNGPKVDMFIEHFLKPIEESIQLKANLLTEQNQQIKGALSISDCTTDKNSKNPVKHHSGVLMGHAEYDGNVSTNSEETLFRCSHCMKDVDEGIQCDECQQWNHCSCEGVSDELFQLYNLQDACYSCLSCRQLETDEEAVESMNSILTEGISMRDPEGDDNVSQSLSGPCTHIVDESPCLDTSHNDSDRQTERFEPIVQNPLIYSMMSAGKDNPVMNKDNITDKSISRRQSENDKDWDAQATIQNGSKQILNRNSPNLIPDTMNDPGRQLVGGSSLPSSIFGSVDHQNHEKPENCILDDGTGAKVLITEKGCMQNPSPVNLDPGSKMGNSALEIQPEKKKKSNPSSRKVNRKDDSVEQLSHAKSVIYSLEKKVEDIQVSNRLLTEELTLLRRQSTHLSHTVSNGPSRMPEMVSGESTEHGNAHSGHNSGPGHQPTFSQGDNSHSGSMTGEHMSSGEVRQALRVSELEVRLLRDRQNALEMEYLKHRLTQVEQINQQLHLTTSILLNSHHSWQPNFLAPMYGASNPLIYRPPPATNFGHPIQASVYPTVWTHPLYYRSPATQPLHTMATFPATTSQIHRGPIHPSDSFNTRRPVQVQNVPHPVTTYNLNETERQPIIRQSVRTNATSHHRTNVHDFYSRPSQVTSRTGTVRSYIHNEDTYGPENPISTTQESSNYTNDQIIKDKDDQAHGVPISGNDGSSPQSEVQMIDLTVSGPFPNDEGRRVPQSDPEISKHTSPAICPATKEKTDHVEGNSSTTTSQSFLGTGRATEATARVEELQLPLSMLKI